MCKNVKQNVLFERSEFTFCSFCMCKSRPETKSEDEAPQQESMNRALRQAQWPHCFCSRCSRNSTGSVTELRFRRFNEKTSWLSKNAAKSVGFEWSAETLLSRKLLKRIVGVVNHNALNFFGRNLFNYLFYHNIVYNLLIYWWFWFNCRCSNRR